MFWQGDNKLLSSKLAEKIAQEKAKALLKSVEGTKRAADGSMGVVPSSLEGQSANKRPKRDRKDKKNSKSKKHST